MSEAHRGPPPVQHPTDSSPDSPQDDESLSVEGILLGHAIAQSHVAVAARVPLEGWSAQAAAEVGAQMKPCVLQLRSQPHLPTARG